MFLCKIKEINFTFKKVEEPTIGGNALKNTVTRRYNADEYFALSKEVIQILADAYDHFVDFRKIAVIPAYSEKETFGDMDVLTTMGFTREQIQKTFSPNEIVKNGDVISFDYKELQIDLIHSPSDEFDYALQYFSFNDCGNLTGKLCHKLGLKHGHNGLFLPIRDGDNIAATICLTKDHDKTLNLVGLDKTRFNNGFETLDQIFDYIAQSPFYSPESYKLENLNTIARVRDKKRETYRKFLEFGEKYTGRTYQNVADKSIYLEKIFTMFPEKYKEYRSAIAELAMKKFAASKFNGDIVSSVTNLKNKELGMFMQYLKTDYRLKTENLVLISEEQIQKLIIEKYSSYTSVIMV